jgi:excisionase family DNA binding protein
MSDQLRDLPLMLTVAEFARIARVGRSAAYESIRRGQIAHVRIGRKVRIPRAALAALLGEKEPEGAES